MSNVTVVTGLWNIKRDELGEGWSRTFQHYLDKFDQLLQIENNMIILNEQQVAELNNFIQDQLPTKYGIVLLQWFAKIQEEQNTKEEKEN